MNSSKVTQLTVTTWLM